MNAHTNQKEDLAMLVRLIIDPDECVGYGECTSEDPEAVSLDEAGRARPLLAELELERAKHLCDLCPSGAIRIDAA